MIMESLSYEEENIIKDIRNIFILKKDIRKLRQKKTKVIKYRMLRQFKNLFEHEKKRRKL